MRLSDVEKFSINNLWNGLYRQLKDCGSLQEAAQCLADACFEEFKESLVLFRIFVTVSYGKLPETNRRFVESLGAKIGHADELSESTPVLSLIGTRGVETSWNDWRLSESHMGIPMISRESVEEIPMLSQLLKDLGLGLKWLSPQEGSIAERRGHTGGVFLVPDAASSTDSEGRKIIPGQEFVEKYGVKTVFGNGARLSVNSNDFLASIFFTRQTLEKDTAHRFNSLIYLFKTTTSHLVEGGFIYP